MSIPSLFSLQHLFSDEAQCIHFLFQKGIFYSEKSCPDCVNSMVLYINRKSFVCPKKNCRREISIKKSSFFEKHTLPCHKILFLGYLWLTKVSSSSIHQLTNHGKTRISNYMKYFRQLIYNTIDEDDTIIGGPGIIVQIDESKLGKRKYHRGHRVNGVWVIGGVEKTDERKAFIIPVANRSADTLLSIISLHVKPGSIIYTDGWKGYCRLSSSLGFTHQTVNHKRYFIDPITLVNTNTIEGTWNGIKLCVSPRNRVRRNIEDHLFEFIWRRKNHENLWEAFIHALSDTLYE